MCVCVCVFECVSVCERDIANIMSLSFQGSEELDVIRLG